MPLFQNSDADHQEPKVKKTWDLSDPATRRRASWKVELEDHAFLRRLWTNRAEVAPGVWRANHPNHAQLARYREKGIRTILNLRGTAKHPDICLKRKAATNSASLWSASASAPARRPRNTRSWPSSTPSAPSKNLSSCIANPAPTAPVSPPRSTS